MQLAKKAVERLHRSVQFLAYSGLGLLSWVVIYEWFKPTIQHITQVIRAGMGW